MKKTLLACIISLLCCGTIFAQTANPKGYATHWPEYQAGLYELVDYHVAFVKIDGNTVTKDGNWADLEMACFVGDAVRGTVFMNNYTPDGVPYPSFEIPVQYTDSGEAVSFKLYDHATGVEYDGTCNYAITTGGKEHSEVYDLKFDEAMYVSFTPSANTGKKH